MEHKRWKNTIFRIYNMIKFSLSCLKYMRKNRWLSQKKRKIRTLVQRTLGEVLDSEDTVIEENRPNAFSV